MHDVPVFDNCRTTDELPVTGKISTAPLKWTSMVLTLFHVAMKECSSVTVDLKWLTGLALTLQTVCISLQILAD